MLKNAAYIVFSLCYVAKTSKPGTVLQNSSTDCVCDVLMKSHTCAKVIISPRRGRCRATSFSSFKHSWNCQQQYHKTFHVINKTINNRDVPNIRFRLTRYQAIFYYPAPNPATLLNDTRYRNQIFYVPTFINSLGAEYSFLLCSQCWIRICTGLCCITLRVSVDFYRRIPR